MSKDVQYQGGWFAQRGLAMYQEVERLTPFQFFVAQGGFNAGGVAASAGTHDREAVDVSGTYLTPDERWTVCTNLRRVGFAAWIRNPNQGNWGWHIHAVPKGGDLSTGASAQVVQYSQHKNGLAGGGPDDGPTGYYDATWEKYTGGSAYRPPINTGGGNGGTKPKKDWFDMASKEDLTDVFRGEGVSGAGDRKYNGVGENTQAIHELGDRIEANLTGLAGKLDQLIEAQAQMVAALKPYVDGPAPN